MAETTITSAAEQVTEKISYDEFLQKYSDVHAEWLWQDPLPKVLEFVRQLGILGH